jgi:ribosome maturation factor RimP
MDRQQTIAELKNIIGDLLRIQGLDLIDLIYRYEAGALVLRILVDRPTGGITLNECAQVNNQISQILDEKDILQTRYILEVSSPGLDRELKSKNDFLRCINRRVRFFLNGTINGKWELEGVVNKVEEEAVSIDADAGTVTIPLSKINKAKQVIQLSHE